MCTKIHHLCVTYFKFGRFECIESPQTPFFWKVPIASKSLNLQGKSCCFGQKCKTSTGRNLSIISVSMKTVKWSSVVSSEITQCKISGLWWHWVWHKEAQRVWRCWCKVHLNCHLHCHCHSFHWDYHCHMSRRFKSIVESQVYLKKKYTKSLKHVIREKPFVSKVAILLLKSMLIWYVGLSYGKPYCSAILIFCKLKLKWVLGKCLRYKHIKYLINQSITDLNLEYWSMTSILLGTHFIYYCLFCPA